MKKIFTLCVLAIALLGTPFTDAQAQEQARKQTTDNHRNDLINTLKERIKLYGYVQTGYTYEETAGEKTNTFDIKRAIVWANAQITDQWTAQLMYNFGGTSSVGKSTGGKILEAWTAYRICPELQIQVGQFKTPFTIENPLSPCTLETIDCNAQMVSYMLGGLIGNHGGRDLGLMVFGELFNKTIKYELALMQGQGLNFTDGNNQKEFVGKLSAKPAEWLLLSVSTMQGTGYCTTARTDYNTVAAGENFKRTRYAAGAQLDLKPLSLRTEYLAGKDGDVKMDGFYASTTIHLCKCLDAIASYDYANYNHDTQAKETRLTGGLQYWFYPQCRLQAQYQFRTPKHGDDTNRIQMQLQIRF